MFLISFSYLIPCDRIIFGYSTWWNGFQKRLNFGIVWKYIMYVRRCESSPLVFYFISNFNLGFMTHFVETYIKQNNYRTYALSLCKLLHTQKILRASKQIDQSSVEINLVAFKWCDKWCEAVRVKFGLCFANVSNKLQSKYYQYSHEFSKLVRASAHHITQNNIDMKTTHWIVNRISSVTICQGIN